MPTINAEITPEDPANIASARAVSREPALSIKPDDSARAVQLGLRTPAHQELNITLARGIGDAIAVVAAHHNEDIHEQYRPHTQLARQLFNVMERLRCESIGAVNRAGIATNLDKLWQNTDQQFHTEDTDQLKLVFACLTKYALKQTVTLTDPIQKVLAIWQETVTTSASELWPRLHNDKHNQANYAATALKIIAIINVDTSNAMSPDAHGTPAQPEEDRRTEEQDTQDVDEEDSDSNAVNTDTYDEDREEQDALLTQSHETEYDEDLSKNKDAPADAESESADGSIGPSTAPYQCYNDTLDEIVHANTLCSASELQTLRQSLDQHIERHKKVVGKLSGQLQRVLMAQQNRHWKFDLEEGLLDTARLTRIVTQPHSGLSFKEESDIEFKNTVVTLLVDNSKSMLGKPIAIAASCADILAQTLERCGVSVEILGFTTTELHGGALFRQWKQQGKSKDPGRLNSLRHIIYKPADVPYRRARTGFGLMLQNDLLKQNIDGEALLWANARLQKRPEERKILLVISDGAPIDTSTMSANRDNYLIDHLHQVINDIERRNTTELSAIGIGHDVTTYYEHAITIRDAKDLANTLLKQLKFLFSSSKNSRRQ